jgi:hypothetical protein
MIFADNHNMIEEININPCAIVNGTDIKYILLNDINSQLYL